MSDHLVNPPSSSAPQTHPILPWTEIDYVLLDMDGTVLDLNFDYRFWYEWVPARYAAANGLSVDAARAELEPHFTRLQGRLEWYCMDHWSGVTRLDLAALKREMRHDIRPLAGSLAFLDAVRAAGKALWLVTNAHVDSWLVKLEHTGLRHHFDEIVCSHDFGAPKEDLRFWQRFNAKHPFDATRSVFVDDNLPVLRMAQTYGIGYPVAIRRPDSQRPARLITEFASVEGLAELLPLPAD